MHLQPGISGTSDDEVGGGTTKEREERETLTRSAWSGAPQTHYHHYCEYEHYVVYLGQNSKPFLYEFKTVKEAKIAVDKYFKKLAKEILND